MNLDFSGLNEDLSYYMYLSLGSIAISWLYDTITQYFIVLHCLMNITKEESKHCKQSFCQLPLELNIGNSKCRYSTYLQVHVLVVVVAWHLAVAVLIQKTVLPGPDWVQAWQRSDFGPLEWQHPYSSTLHSGFDKTKEGKIHGTTRDTNTTWSMIM